MNMRISLNNNKEILEYLSNQFPLCFSLTGQAKPLKIGIFQDLIVALNLNEESSLLSKTKLRQALRAYTSNWRYLHSIKAGENRVDLYGKEVELVSMEDAEFAQKELIESKKRANEFKQNKEKIKPKSKPKQPNLAGSSTETIKANQALFVAGQVVKVQIGEDSMDATLVSIGKEVARVKLFSGMELAVAVQQIKA